MRQTQDDPKRPHLLLTRLCPPTPGRRKGRHLATTLVIGDIHIPQHDQVSVDLVLRWVRDHQPDEIILNGDVLDCYEISRFKQPGSPGPGLAEEIRQGRAFLAELRGAAGPRCRIQWIEGNHCFRFRSYIANEAPTLAGLDHNVTLPGQLHFEEHGIEFIEATGERWFSTYVEAAPGILVGHFSKTSINAGYAAKGLLDKHGVSLITGHGHAMGTSHRTHYAGPIFGYEGGCLCDLAPPYCEPGHWAHGFHLIHQRDGQRPVIERVVIDNHAFCYGGKWYA